MCGIVAVFAQHESVSKERLETQLHSALERIAHRGPDAQGIWISDSSHCGESSLSLLSPLLILLLSLHMSTAYGVFYSTRTLPPGDQ